MANVPIDNIFPLSKTKRYETIGKTFIHALSGYWCQGFLTCRGVSG
jgi:hypothetical protein